MAANLHLCRRGALYHFRRRLHLRGILSCHITIPLRTADPGQARRLAARLAVRWDAMTMDMHTHGERGYLKAGELAAVFRAGLEAELGLATAPLLDLDPTADGDQRTARVFEATYRIAARIPPDATEVDWALLVKHTPSFDDRDRRAVALVLRAIAPHRAAWDEANRLLLDIDAPITDATVRDARVQLLQARAEAQGRMAFAAHPRVVGAGNVAARLLDDDLVADLRMVQPAPPPQAEVSEASPFLMLDQRRFSEIIDDTIAGIQLTGDWNADVAQRRRTMWAFAWITDDKRLCDYRPSDIELFARTLQRLPTSFRWGTPEQGAMSRPLGEVLKELPPVTKGEVRSARTLNRDLTTLSRVARELSKVAWKPRLGGAAIMNFTDFAAGVRDDVNDPDRMPWTTANLVAAFSSPIYTGGGDCMKRFKKPSAGGTIWQDAAYWVPLIMAYTFVAREEACGLEVADFVFDVATPYLVIRANLTRSKDGETPGGLKRAARFRMIPLHPELLRLGIRAYIECIALEGHVMAFPELYQEQHIKRGGARFYACAGRYLLAYVDEVEPLLRTRSGKRADLHSMRTSGASALEDNDVKQIAADDIMGHAREGTGPRKYSRAWYSRGGDAILAKRLQLMIDVTPNVTSHLQPARLQLLPLDERSRTGSASGCVSRSKA